MITARIDDAAWRAQVAKLARALGKGVPEVIADEARLFFAEALRRLPPKTQAQGRKAVARDLGHATQLQRPQDWESERIRHAIRRRDYPKVRAIFRNSAARKNWHVDPFRPEQHTQARDRRGRVQRQRRQATLDARAWRAHLRASQMRVGLLKAPFAFALVRLGGRAPGWLSRHFPRVARQYKDRLRQPQRPHVSLALQLYDARRFEPLLLFALRVRLGRMARRIASLAAKGWRP